MQKKTILIGLILLTLLLGGWLRFYFSDEQVIKRDFTKLGAEISKQEQETSIQMALNMKKVKDRLRSPCQIIIPEQNNASLESDMIIRYLMYYRQLYTEIEFTFIDMSINLHTDGNATVQSTIHLLRKNKSKTRENIEEIIFFLSKHDGTWQINKVLIPQVLIE